MEDEALVVQIIQDKIEKLDDFENLTKSYMEKTNELTDDIEKAEKFSSMINLREVVVNEVLLLQKKIDSDENLSKIYNSDNEAVNCAKNAYNDKLNQLKQLQIEVIKLSDEINEELRIGFKKIKDAQTFNSKYFEHGDILGSSFNFNT